MAKVVQGLDPTWLGEIQRSDSADIPEYKLMIAILGRAIQDALGRCLDKREANARDAATWLYLNSDAPRLEYPGARTHVTFAEVCEALSICPIMLHAKLKERIKRENKEMQVAALFVVRHSGRRWRNDV